MRAITLSALLAFFAGCSAPVDLLFSAAARQELVDNLEASVDAQHMIAEYAYAVAHGDVDISGRSTRRRSATSPARSRSRTASSPSARAT